jgi:hypothetical protein
MEHNQSNSTKFTLSLLQRGGAIIHVMETYFVFDEDGHCLYKINQMVMDSIKKDERLCICRKLESTIYSFDNSEVEGKFYT